MVESDVICTKFEVSEGWRERIKGMAILASKTEVSEIGREVIKRAIVAL